MSRKDILLWATFKTLPAVVFIVIFITFLCSSNYRITALYDSDINWLLKTGEFIFTNGFQLPKQDIFSYTFQGSWTLYQWLYEVLIYFVYSIGGATSIGNLSTLFLAGTFTVCYLIMRIYKVPIVYSVLSIVVGMTTSSIIWYARPSIVTYFFDALLLLIFITAETKNKRILFFIPPIFLLWSNFHLGFTSGIFVLTTYILYKLLCLLFKSETNSDNYIQTLLFVALLTVIATLINPYGWNLYEYFINLANIKIMNNNILELLSPNFHNKFYHPMIAMIFLLVFLSKYGKKVNLFYTFLTAFSLCTALMFTRNIPFFAIIASITLALCLKELHCKIINSDKITSWIKFIFNKIEAIQQYEVKLMAQAYPPTKIPLSICLICMFLLILIPLQQSNLMQKTLAFSMDYPKYRPYYAYQYVLKHNIPGRFFTEPSWGSYAIVKLYPKYSVFIDTRFDMYGEDFFKLYQDLKEGVTGFNKVAKEYNINWVCIPTNKSYYKALIKGKDWFLIYTDKVASIFLKRSKANEEWYKSISQNKQH